MLPGETELQGDADADTISRATWQKCGADLFKLGSKTNLQVVDYVSRYVEIALPTPTRSSDITAPEVSFCTSRDLQDSSDRQVSGAAFAEFGESCGFLHVTSIPKYPQGNAEAEHDNEEVRSSLFSFA